MLDHAFAQPRFVRQLIEFLTCRKTTLILKDHWSGVLVERDLLDIWEERAHRHQISNLIIVQRSGLYITRVPEGYCSLISWSLPLLEAHPNPQELKLLYRSKMTTTYFQTIHKHVCILMLTISLDDPNCVNYYSFLQTVWPPLNSHPIRDFFL